VIKQPGNGKKCNGAILVLMKECVLRVKFVLALLVITQNVLTSASGTAISKMMNPVQHKAAVNAE
jgi:hypothetical protein